MTRKELLFGLFLSLISHIFANSDPDVTPLRNCIDLSLARVDGIASTLKEITDNTSILSEGKSKSLRPFGASETDWTRLNLLRDSLPEDSVLKNQFNHVLRLLVVAHLQASQSNSSLEFDNFYDNDTKTIGSSTEENVMSNEKSGEDFAVVHSSTIFPDFRNFEKNDTKTKGSPIDKDIESRGEIGNVRLFGKAKGILAASGQDGNVTLKTVPDSYNEDPPIFFSTPSSSGIFGSSPSFSAEKSENTPVLELNKPSTPIDAKKEAPSDAESTSILPKVVTGAGEMFENRIDEDITTVLKMFPVNTEKTTSSSESQGNFPIKSSNFSPSILPVINERSEENSTRIHYSLPSNDELPAFFNSASTTINTMQLFMDLRTLGSTSDEGIATSASQVHKEPPIQPSTKVHLLDKTVTFRKFGTSQSPVTNPRENVPAPKSQDFQAISYDQFSTLEKFSPGTTQDSPTLSQSSRVTLVTENSPRSASSSLKNETHTQSTLAMDHYFSRDIPSPVQKLPSLSISQRTNSAAAITTYPTESTSLVTPKVDSNDEMKTSSYNDGEEFFPTEDSRSQQSGIFAIRSGVSVFPTEVAGSTETEERTVDDFQKTEMHAPTRKRPQFTRAKTSDDESVTKAMGMENIKDGKFLEDIEKSIKEFSETSSEGRMKNQIFEKNVLRFDYRKKNRISHDYKRVEKNRSFSKQPIERQTPHRNYIRPSIMNQPSITMERKMDNAEELKNTPHFRTNKLKPGKRGTPNNEVDGQSRWFYGQRRLEEQNNIRGGELQDTKIKVQCKTPSQ